MSKIIIRALGICLVICLLLTGCGKTETEIKPMEAEEVVTFGFDFNGGNDVMTVSGFYGPSAPMNSRDGVRDIDTVTEQVFSDLAEAGVNHLSGIGWDMLTSGNTPNNYGRKMFEYGEKYGVAMTLQTDIKDFALVNTAQDVLKPIKDKYKSFVSVFVCDEPAGPNYFENPANEVRVYQPYFEVLNKLGYYPYCNLFPLYDLEQTNEFIEYVDIYLETCNPPVLSYDHYINSNSAMKPYFANMSIIREKAEAKGIPWWGFIAAWVPGSHLYDNPTEWEFYWNINTTLAYGAKGLQYYTGVSNREEVTSALADFDTINEETISKAATRVGILGGWGHRTRWWHYSKNITKQIRAVDEVLMNSVNKGVIAACEAARKDLKLSTHVIKGESWRELQEVKGDAMIGCFNYNGKSAFYVVNYDKKYAQHITLNFQDKYKMKVVQNAENSYFETSSLTLDMTAGEGVLIVME